MIMMKKNIIHGPLMKMVLYVRVFPSFLLFFLFFNKAAFHAAEKVSA